MTEVQTACLGRIAEAKAVPLDSLGLDTTLESIGMDSLDRVSLSFDLEEAYGVEIPETRLQEIRTIGDAANAVQDALHRKMAAAATEPGAGAA